MITGNKMFAIGILVFLIIAVTTFFSISDVRDNQDEQWETTQVESISNTADSVFNEAFKEKYMESNPIKYFNPQNVQYYWVGRWNAPCSDGGAYDGWFIMGTKVDSLVYYINSDSGKPSEERFYYKHLVRDPRASIWWQSFIGDINQNDRVKTLKDAIEVCACTDDATRIESLYMTKYIVEDIKKLNLIHTENPTRDDIRIILLRYTSLYYGDNFSYEQAVEHLRKWDIQT